MPMLIPKRTLWTCRVDQSKFKRAELGNEWGNFCSCVIPCPGAYPDSDAKSKNRTNREWISNSDKEMPLKWPETGLESILLSNIGQYTQKAISRVRSALKCVFRVVRQIHDKTVRKYTQIASWSKVQAKVTSMFDDDDNKLNPNDDDNLNDDSPIAWCYIRVQGRIKFKIKRCTDNDD